MNLFELSAQYQKLMDEINQNEEISEDLIKNIEAINDSLESKVLNYTSIIKSLSAKAESIDKAIEGMEKRSQSLKESVEYLKNVVKSEMAKCDKKKIENEYHSVSLQLNNPKVNYLDKTLIPEQFMRRKIHEIIEPNGTLILKALKENLTVPGVTIVRDQRLSIR